MSAIVLPGNKRSFFEETSSSPPLISKRHRCSLSPVRISPDRHYSVNPFAASVALDHLSSLFPGMDKELLERALKECGYDLDSAIKSLTELRLGSDGNTESLTEKVEQPYQGLVNNGGDIAHADDPLAAENLPKNGTEWVELFVKEMTSSSDINDARARASRVLEVLEKSICVRVGAEATQNFQMENMTLKQKLEALIHENSILKRAVAIQHERQKESDSRSEELEHLKQMVSQYQEQLRTLEVNNYALTMHLKQAEQSSSIPGRFHPDVF